jgi:hypothetical protein
MDVTELAGAIAAAMGAKETLDPALAAVIRDLVPDKKQRGSLEPLILRELERARVEAARRMKIKTWWNDFVVEARDEVGEADSVVAALLSDHDEAELSSDVDLSSLGAWFRTDYGEVVLLSHFFEDLRSMVGLRDQPVDLQLILGSYQREFQSLAESGDLQMLREAVDELSGEFIRCGKPVAETLKPVLSVALVDALSERAVDGNTDDLSHVLAVARAFGPAGFRVVMAAIGKTTGWEILEGLRAEVHSYGPEVVDELLKWLSHSDVRVAKEAVLLVRKVGDERVAPRLEPLLNHSDAEYRAAALATLAKIGGSRRQIVIERGLSDQSAIVVDVALDAAAEFGPQHFVGVLGRLLLRHRQDTEFHHVRAKAIRLIGSRQILQLENELQEIVKGVESWVRFTRDEALVPYAVRSLLQLHTTSGRVFVQKRMRWWRARGVREACKQALREVETDYE